MKEDAEYSRLEDYIQKYIKPKTPEEYIIESLKKVVKDLSKYYITLPSGITVSAQELWERYQEGERSPDTEYLFSSSLEVDRVLEHLDRLTKGAVRGAKKKKIQGAIESGEPKL